MPTIATKDGFRMFFYSEEGNEPPHVHVQYQSAVAKFWLKPVILASNFGMKGKELSKAAKLVQEYEEIAKGKWDEYFTFKK